MYPDWLANVVVAPKKENKLKMCMDYKYLNKACPKDSFPLPNIDHMMKNEAWQLKITLLWKALTRWPLPLAL